MQSLKDRMLEKAARAHIPMIGSFELLPVCNLSCKMCYVRKSMAEVRALGGLKDGDWWLETARQAAECGMVYPLLTGGEPFLHPDFARIHAGTLELGMQTSINTNATLIDREWAAFLGKHRPTRVNITLYGASEETYQDLCGDGSAYGRVLEAVELLKAQDVRVKFNTSITPQNVQDMEALISYAKDQNCPIQVATYMFPPVRRDSSLVGTNDRLSPEEAALARVRSDFIQGEPLWFAAQAERYRRFVPLDRKPWEMGPGFEKGMGCRAGLCSLWIDWQGNFTNCGMYGSAHSSLKDRTFREAWDEIVTQTADVRYAPDCLGCPNEHLCHPCIAMISNECGSHRGRPEYMCRMNQAMADYYAQFMEKYYPDVKTNYVIPQESLDSCEI